MTDILAISCQHDRARSWQPRRALTYGDPASDISALCYLGNEFINLFLKYYKNSDKDIEKRINMFIKAREVMSFENMVNNFPEEINEQIEKIKKVL